MIKSTIQFDKKNLFDLMLDRVKDIQQKLHLKDYEAFPSWFINMYFYNITKIYTTDGARDGKIDTIFTTQNNEYVKHFVLNSKFTKEYGKLAPPSFYDEIISFSEVFNNKSRRENYIDKYVRKELRHKYQDILELYDDGKVELFFLTNFRKNDLQYNSYNIESYNVNIIHLEDIIQYMIDDLEGAMPRTETLHLTGINNILYPSKEDSKVPTILVFAKVIDFINYMKKDPYDLLFARNIRLDLGNTEPNENIKNTFKDFPEEFAFSNNGITLICEEIIPDLPGQELKILNPRVVNGSQTLHSVRYIDKPSINARVMLRIIKVGKMNPDTIDDDAIKRKEIIHKISIRSNLQNPIKKWNLVANDDFQNSLKRYFRSKNLFYETRKGEWKARKLELKQVNIKNGPFITRLTQLIASFYYNDKDLGPALAYGKLNELFDEDNKYDKITKIQVNDVYKIFLLGEIIKETLKYLKKYQYINEIKDYIFLSLFALFIKLIKDHLKLWEKENITEILENYYEKSDLNIWNNSTKEFVKHVFYFYDIENLKYKKERKIKTDLNFNNFFKNQKYISNIISKHSK